MFSVNGVYVIVIKEFLFSIAVVFSKGWYFVSDNFFKVVIFSNGFEFYFFTWGLIFFFKKKNADCFRFQKYFSHWFVLFDVKCFCFF